MRSRSHKPDSPEAIAIDAIAAEWIAKREAGASARQEREFTAWLEADPRHAQAYVELASASRRLDFLQALRPNGANRPDPGLPFRPHKADAGDSRRFVPLWLPLAAAAAFAVFFLNPWTPRRAEFNNVATTLVGGLRKLPLPDKSEINLNTDTRLNISFSALERRIVLMRGEAHFTVARDSTRPFIVEVGGVSVRAVGTAFNVRLLDAAVEVIVTHGKVGVENAAEMRSAPSRLPPPIEFVVAGQRALVTAPANPSAQQPVKVVVAPVSHTEISQRLAWQENRLDFAPTALKDIVAEFNRYDTHRLIIADPEVAAINVGGSFRAGDVEALVRLLESNFDIKAEIRGEETVLRKRR